MSEPEIDYSQRGVDDYHAGRDPFRDKAFFQLQTREEQAQWLGWVSARARENNFLNNNPHQPKGSQ